jgi:hypothetical protein
VRLELDSARITALLNAAADDAALTAAHQLHGLSQQVVPLEEGTLQNDSGVELVGPGEAQVWYGRGPANAYAIVQHEHLEFRHAPGRVAKYLEGPLRANARQLTETMARTVRAHLEGA